jgi:superfamily II DNA or RNA helicase
LAKRAKKKVPDLLIVDEAHILHRSVIKMIKDNPQLKVLGLTATPFTKGLGSIFTNVVAGPTYEDIIEKQWLVPLKVYIAKEIDMEGAKKVAGEWSAEEVTSRGVQITGDIVAEWEKKSFEMFKKAAKTIVFCAGVAHGRDLEKKFKEAGYNFVSISYKEDDEFKRMTIEEFSKPDSEIHGLIATDILTRGFDVSDVMIGVSARPFSKSFSSHVQQIGRVMRPHPGKEFGLWLDHAGNFLRFKGDWDTLYTEGVKELKDGGEKAKKEPTEKEKKESKCPKCKALWTFPSDTCLECGFIRQRLSEVINVAGTLEALELKPNKAFNTQKFYSELVYYARMKGYKDCWAAHKFKEKTGSFPRGLSAEPAPLSLETSNWIRSKMIAFAKSRASGRAY